MQYGDILLRFSFVKNIDRIFQIQKRAFKTVLLMRQKLIEGSKWVFLSLLAVLSLRNTVVL